MNSEYVFKKPERKAVGTLLKPGDYNFVVSEITAEPYVNPKKKWVLKVKLSIDPDGVTVYAAPWSGRTVDGEDRNGIEEFLMAVNRAPADQQKPNWSKVVGARGRCRLRHEPDQDGNDRNGVHYFHIPKQIGPSASKQSVSLDEFEKVRQKQVEASGGGAGEIDEDNIPYACDRY